MLYISEFIAHETLYSVQNDSFSFKSSCISRFCGNRLCRKSLIEHAAPEKNLSTRLDVGRMNFVLMKLLLTVFWDISSLLFLIKASAKSSVLKRTSSTSVGTSFIRPDNKPFSVGESSFSWLFWTSAIDFSNFGSSRSNWFPNSTPANNYFTLIAFSQSINCKFIR